MPNRLTASPLRTVFPLTSTPASTITTVPEEEEVETSNNSLLLDYLSRLNKWSQNLKKYRELYSSSSTSSGSSKEPITAFTSLTSNSNSNNSGFNTPKNDSYLSHVLSNFSLIDLERTLFSGISGSSSKGDSSDLVGDGIGLDIDLSNAFNATTTLQEQEQESTQNNDSNQSSALEIEGPPIDKGPGLFLNYYSSQDLIKLFNTSGVLLALSKKGYNSPSLVFDTSDSLQHRLSLVDSSLFPSTYHHHATAEEEEAEQPKEIRKLAASERFLVDLYMKRRSSYTLSSITSYQLMLRLLSTGSWSSLRNLTGEIRAPYIGLEGAKEVIKMFELLVERCSKKAKSGKSEWDITEICWLQMHDPLKEVTRPLLPGQRFPGLGLGREIATVMEQMAIASRKTDALVNFPFHYHNAVTYQQRGWKHLDPIYEAYVEWITIQLKENFIDKHGFCFVAWAISLGHLRRETYLLPSSTSSCTSTTSPKLLSTRLERWSPSEQLFPTSNSMESYFSSKEYNHLLEKYRKIFKINGGAMESGVSSIVDVISGDGEEKGVEEGGVEKECRLVIDLENCPELWKYSNDERWRTRDPETGEFTISI